MMASPRTDTPEEERFTPHSLMYIFLRTGDLRRESDEWYDADMGEWCPVCQALLGQPFSEKEDVPVRRHLGPWEAVRHALQNIPDADATTTPDFWDCECLGDYIHAKHDDDFCQNCHANRDDQPDSRLREVLLSLLKEKTS